MDEYLSSLREELKSRAEALEILSLLQKELQYSPTNSFHWKVLRALILVVEKRMDKESLYRFLNPLLYPFLIKDQTYSGSEIQDVLNLIQFLKSDQRFEKLVNSVISKGDQWDENP